MTVPVDYRKLRGATIGVAVIRKPATGERRGSLVVNPGGPGGSGLDFVRRDAGIFSHLSDHFDLVSFDPRGVGESHPVRCISSAQLDRYIHTDPAPSTPAQLRQSVRGARGFAAGCRRRNGRFLAHIGTVDVARDMDVLRAALREPKLTYYGASYGTYLGAKYAQLYPHRIRAMVLDGAIDPAISSSREALVQSEGFEANLSDFIASCVRSGQCSLGGSTASATSAVNATIARITAHPEPVGSRSLGPGELFEGVAAALYSPSDWPALQVALAQAGQGNGALLLHFSDSLTGRQADGSYSNLVESNIAINCVDRPQPQSLRTVARLAARDRRAAPHFGAGNEFGLLPCAYWPVPPVGRPHPVHAIGAPPIVVIGTTRDPATPYVWARSLARQLSSGVLLTFVGDGHTAYDRGDACVLGAVDPYLLDLQPPPAATTCH